MPGIHAVRERTDSFPKPIVKANGCNLVIAWMEAFDFVEYAVGMKHARGLPSGRVYDRNLLSESCE